MLQVSNLILSLLLLSAEALAPKDAILLSQVRTLTLKANSRTTHRRVSAIPQLTCKGQGCAYYKVDVMRCQNQGSAYNPEDIEWSCTASLPPEFKLGSTEVMCEGYSHQDDKYVLKGSCGVEYRLLLTGLGQEKYGKNKGFDRHLWPFVSYIFPLAFFGILILILYSALKVIPFGNFFRRPGQYWGNSGGGGGGGGGGDPWDPPPPYPGKDYGFQQRQGRWAPGFWTGALGGAAAGYFAGNRFTREEPSFTERDRIHFRNRDDSPRSSTSSSSRYESTGFGSTSRR